MAEQELASRERLRMEAVVIYVKLRGAAGSTGTHSCGC